MFRKLNSRSFHRYLSLFVGLQLFLWSLSGLMFCWIPYDQVLAKHHLRKLDSADISKFELTDLRHVLVTRLEQEPPGTKLLKAELRMLLDRPVYELEFQSDGLPNRWVLLDGISGQPISPLSRETAEAIALRDFDETVPVVSAMKLDSPQSSHSEYRGKDLPAWRIELDHNSRTAIYVSADRGIITARRNVQWRVFDFFWMIHTMDYQGRDNFNTWLLWFASIGSLTSIASGFWLWWQTSRVRARWKRNRKLKTV